MHSGETHGSVQASPCIKLASRIYFLIQSFDLTCLEACPEYGKLQVVLEGRMLNLKGTGGLQVSQLGATSILVNDGVNLKALGQGLQRHVGSSSSS